MQGNDRTNWNGSQRDFRKPILAEGKTTRTAKGKRRKIAVPHPAYPPLRDAYMRAMLNKLIRERSVLINRLSQLGLAYMRDRVAEQEEEYTHTCWALDALNAKILAWHQMLLDVPAEEVPAFDEV